MTDDRKTNNRPEDTLRDGNVKADIWRNEKPDGGAFYGTTFSRSYRDEEGKYHDTNSFMGTDLLKLSELARHAYNRTNELRRDDAEVRKEFQSKRGENNGQERDRGERRR